MRRRNCTIGGWILLLLAISCAEPLPLHDRPEGESIPVRFALSLEGGTPATKADVNTVTELNGATFRGMTDIHILAFSREGKVQPGDEALAQTRYLPAIPSNGLIDNNHAHLFQNGYLALPHGTASMLIYGKSPTVTNDNWNEQERKHRNGSLSENPWTLSASSVTFTPEPIIASNTASQDAANQERIISEALSYMVYDSDNQTAIQSPSITFYYNKNGTTTAGFTTVRWNAAIENEALRACFNWFTGNGQMMSAAGNNVEYMLTALYNKIVELRNGFSSVTASESHPYIHTDAGRQYETFTDASLQSPLTQESLYLSLCNAILARFDSNPQITKVTENEEVSYTLTGEQHEFPLNLGLPAGASVLRWQGTTFVPVTTGDFDRIAATGDFCYMPALYYYANTTIHTSWDEKVDAYYNSSSASWREILGHYNSGNKVVGETRAVALDDSLQFACSMLIANVRATTSQLPDKNQLKINVENADVFPVTGIIIGGQYQQDLNFAPTTETDAREYYLYDNQISNIGLKYSSSTTSLSSFRTLVFPTRESADVYFYMEFRNNSGTAFTGADGVILPGGRFYLAGKLDFPTDQSQQQEVFSRIFTQDHYTTVSCVVSSLENAFLCVPEMGPQLRLGVKTQVKWATSAPLTIKLE